MPEPNVSIFDNKIFNGDVFKGYIDRLPNPRLTELIKSKAIRPRPDLAQAMADQDGGNYITTTLKGLISNSTPQNYDGSTNIIPNSTVSFKHGRVVTGRMGAWTERDFSYDITGGQDFIENVAQQISEYWSEVDQDTIVATLTGIFNMSDAEGQKFVNAHTHDIRVLTNSEGAVGKMDGTSLNTAMQKACGDNKSKFSLTIMHSVVATNLENLKLLAYMKYTDEQNIERDLALGTLNGRLVLVDDSMPVTEVPASEAVAAVAEVKGVHTLAISADAIVDDAIAVTYGGKTVTYTADGAATATNIAKTLKNMLSAVPEIADVFTVTQSSSNVLFTQKSGGTGALPTVTVTQAAGGTLAASISTTTPGAAAVAAKAAVVEHSEYTTFVLGDGAIEMTDCGAKVPYEVDRDPKTNGGQDTLYSRQRKCFAPYGISFTQASMESMSPTDAELRNGVNWELVSSKGDNPSYIEHKTIPIARIISLG